MIMQKSGVDTSPIIIDYDKRYNPGGSVSDYAGRCITDAYAFTSVTNEDRYLISYGMQNSLIVYQDGAYKDYWNYNSVQSEQRTVGLAIGCDQVKFTLEMSMLDDCYAYQESTGIIFFAGKNSIYYGHRNISELN